MIIALTDEKVHNDLIRLVLTALFLLQLVVLLVLFRFRREIMLNQQGINHAGLREEKFQHHHLRSVETFH